ncbi:MAG: phosphate ABC transporter permease subunit PstC [bacterium]|nr:phosphate ABC transporter permease subunit PstC [bacterium]
MDNTPKRIILVVLPYIAALAAILLSLFDPGVLGWLLYYGGIAAIAVMLLSRVVTRFIPQRVREAVINTFIAVTGYLSIIAVLFIFVFICKEGIGAFITIPLADMFLDTVWQPNSVEPKYSFLPLIAGTFIVTGLAMLISVPIGVFTAVYVAEIAKGVEKEIIKPAVELLAGIPSVIYGLLGLVVLGDVIPAITGTPFRLNALNGAVVLAVMLTPLIASISEDALYNVPRTYRTAAYALGATRFEVITRAVLPAAISGIAAAVLLGLARTLGETMAVLMATGNAAQLTFNPLASVRTMTANIAIEMGEVPRGSEHYHALFAIGIVLFTLTFVVNIIADAVMTGFAKKLGKE